MSTTVDKKARAPRSSAAESRQRILEAARTCFTQAGYDTIGVRQIADVAGVDPAMVSRLFGSKEALFTLVAADAFRLDPLFEGPIDGMGERIARHLLGPLTEREPDTFDEFAFLLRSVGSPAAAPILATAVHEDFVVPFSRRMSGADAEARAALITAYLLGFSVLRAALGSPALEQSDATQTANRLGDAIQACLDR